MEPQGPLYITSASTPASLGKALRAWQVGELLHAVVTRVRPDGQTELRIGDQPVQARTQTPLTEGQRLVLQVAQTGKPVVLRVQTPAQTQQPLMAALSTTLPRQAPLPPLLANLAAVARNEPQERPTPLPPGVSRAARRVLDSLPSVRQVSEASGLKRALQNSGVYLESRLLQISAGRGEARDGLGTDLKAQLLRVAALLRSLQDAPAPARAQSQAPDNRHAKATPASREGTPLPQRTPDLRAPLPPASNQDSKTLPTAPSAPPKPAHTAPAQPRSPAVSGQNRSPQEPFAASSASRSSSAPPPIRGVPVQAQPPTPPTLLAARSLPQMTAQLLEQVEGAIARIQLNQLGSVPADTGGNERPVFTVELPVRGEARSDVIHLRIEQDDEHGADEHTGRRSWRVVLGFDLPALGPVHAVVTVGGPQVSADFLAPSSTTARRLEAHLGTLHDALTGSGLQANRLSARTGALQEEQQAGIQYLTLLDTRA